MPDIDWVHELSPPNPNSTSFIFMESLRDCFLTQHVMQPTHKRGDQQANILDLILTNEDNMIEDLVKSSLLTSLKVQVLCRIQVKQCKNVQVRQGRPRKTTSSCQRVRPECGRRYANGRGWRYLEENITTAMNKSIPKSNRIEGPQNRSNISMWMNNTALVKGQIPP